MNDHACHLTPTIISKLTIRSPNVMVPPHNTIAQHSDLRQVVFHHIQQRAPAVGARRTNCAQILHRSPHAPKRFYCISSLSLKVIGSFGTIDF